MKKVFAVAFGLVMLTAMSALADLSYDQAAQVLSKALASQGYNCDVEIGDVDKNGVNDVAIEYQSGNPDDTILHLLAATTGGVGALDEEVSWTIDKVFVLINEELWYASVKGINQCYDVINDDESTDQDVEDCLYDVWNKKG